MRWGLSSRRGSWNLQASGLADLLWFGSRRRVWACLTPEIVCGFGIDSVTCSNWSVLFPGYEAPTVLHSHKQVFTPWTLWKGPMCGASTQNNQTTVCRARGYLFTCTLSLSVSPPCSLWLETCLLLIFIHSFIFKFSFWDLRSFSGFVFHCRYAQ